MAELTDEELLADLGVETEADPKAKGSARSARIVAGFEEIERFFEKNGRVPTQNDDNDIFERLYAVRLQQIRSSEECLDVLVGKDKHGLLRNIAADEKLNSVELDDEALLADLGVMSSEKTDITHLKHVKSRAEVRAAEEIARRTPCLDFNKFEPLFLQVQSELETGYRQTMPYRENAKVNAGDLYILGGQKVYVADVGEEIIDQVDKTDRRLRVIYDNGTESNLLLRSLQRALSKDDAARRISDPTVSGPLFSGILEASDSASGTVYVLRSKSDNPTITQSREVIHKIGVTSDDVKKRIANAKLDPTFLMSDVELVATYELSNISRTKLENVIHRFFEPARLDIEIRDRFGNPVIPREWFLVPLFAIDEAIKRIKDGSIVKCRYDVAAAKIVEEN